MKVALVVEHFEPDRGGAETAAGELAAALQRADIATTVVTTGTESALYTTGPGVQVLQLPVRLRSRLARTRRFLSLAARAVTAGPFDIIHSLLPLPGCHVYQPRGGTYRETIRRSIARRAPGLPQAFHRFSRTFNRRQRWLQAAEERLLRRTDPPVVAAVSDYVRRQVLEIAPLPAERVPIIFNAVDVDMLPVSVAPAHTDRLRQKIGVAPEQPLILTVAHNFALKNLGALVDTLALPGAESWALAVAGRDQPAAYQRQASRRGVADRLHFLGTPTHLAECFLAADVLAHPTWYDPCSRVVLEALCLACPVVTTRWNGAAEAFTHGVHGEVLTDPSDRPALAAALQRTLDPQRKAACQRARDSFRRYLSMSRHAAELITLYERILGRGAR